MSHVIEHDVVSGQITRRDLTSAEKKDLKNLAAKEAARAEDAKAEAQAREVAMQDAIAHAKSLGFTDEMVAVMYPTLRTVDMRTPPGAAE